MLFVVLTIHLSLLGATVVKRDDFPTASIFSVNKTLHDYPEYDVDWSEPVPTRITPPPLVDATPGGFDEREGIPSNRQGLKRYPQLIAAPDYQSSPSRGMRGGDGGMGGYNTGWNRGGGGAGSMGGMGGNGMGGMGGNGMGGNGGMSSNGGMGGYGMGGDEMGGMGGQQMPYYPPQPQPRYRGGMVHGNPTARSRLTFNRRNQYNGQFSSPMGYSYAGYIERQARRYPIMMYTLVQCVPCQRAKHLLAVSYADAAAHFLELVGDEDWQRQLQVDLQQMTGQVTFPYIFICGQHIGGASDLFALHQSGQLRSTLNSCQPRAAAAAATAVVASAAAVAATKSS